MATLKYTHFTTDAYPGDRRVDAWRDALGHVSLGLQGTADLGTFYGQARAVVSPLGIVFTRLSASGQSLTGQAQTRAPGAWIALQLAGSGRLDSADGRSEIGVGDFAYGPLCGSFSLAYADDFRVLFTLLPQGCCSRAVSPRWSSGRASCAATPAHGGSSPTCWRPWPTASRH